MFHGHTKKVKEAIFVMFKESKILPINTLITICS